MQAAIDVGSNTVRMLVAKCQNSTIKPVHYRQQITRLAGGFTPEKGLSLKSIERTLAALSSFAEDLQLHAVEQVRIVGTAACRQADNAGLLSKQLKLGCRLNLEIISGEEEARLSAAGILSVLTPLPNASVLIDIGGGSTEIVFCHQGDVLCSSSYPLGVVRLCEEMPDPTSRQRYLKDMVVKFSSDILHSGISPSLLANCALIGTAGTITTLAAIDLKMTEYDPARINNHQLDFNWLQSLQKTLSEMSVAEREKVPGLEPGRGDVIIPGLELVLALCSYFKQSSLRVADAGLLEGIILDFCRA